MKKIAASTRAVNRAFYIVSLSAMCLFTAGAWAGPPRERPPAGDAEVITLRGIDAEGNELSLHVPVDTLMSASGAPAPAGTGARFRGAGQLQQPGTTTSINLSQIAGTSVSSSLYDGSNNALKVNCIVGCSATGGFTDSTAFTTGSTAVTNVSGLFNDSATNLTSGNAGAIRATTDRMLFVNIGKINGTVPTLTGSSLNVNCTGGCSGASSFADNSAFAAGTTGIGITGGWFSSSPTACTSGNACAPNLTSDRKLFVQAFQGTSPWVVSASGNFGVTQQTSPWADNITQWNSVALGSPSAYGTSPGAVNVPGVNAFITNTPSVSGTVTANAGTGTFNENLAQVNGSTVATAATGVQKVGVTGNAGAAFDAPTGSAPPANAVQDGGLGSGATGGLVTAIPVCDSYANVNISTATTTLEITGVSGRQVRICAFDLIAAAADNVAFIEGTGSTCGTGTAGMAGGTTAASGYNLAANGGIAHGSGLGVVMKTATAGDSVCLMTSAATQLSGGISYAIY